MTALGAQKHLVVRVVYEKIQILRTAAGTLKRTHNHILFPFSEIISPLFRRHQKNVSHLVI